MHPLLFRLTALAGLSLAGPACHVPGKRETTHPITTERIVHAEGAIDLSVELREAHRDAPPTPVRLHGILLGDVPRGPGGP